MEIIPAILPRDFAEIEEKVEMIKGYAKTVQIDICDGAFVPSSTWPYKKQDENFEAIMREDKGMPAWEKVDYEFDLMIKDPSENDMRQWLSAGAARIIVHLESSNDLNPCLAVINGLVEIGLAINLDTPLSEIEKYADKINFIQCMGIRKIGFQGQKFDADTINKVKEIKTLYPHLKVSVDGGVSLENAPLLKHAGADRVVAGSAIFDESGDLENIIHSIQKFKSI